MQIPVKFHAAVIAHNASTSQYDAEIQVKTETGQIVTVWADQFFTAIDAMQSMTRAFGEMQ